MSVFREYTEIRIHDMCDLSEELGKLDVQGWEIVAIDPPTWHYTDPSGHTSRNIIIRRIASST